MLHKDKNGSFAFNGKKTGDFGDELTFARESKTNNLKTEPFQIFNFMTPVQDANICRLRRELNYSIWTFYTACRFKGTYTAKDSSLTLEHMKHEAAKKSYKNRTILCRILKAVTYFEQ